MKFIQFFEVAKDVWCLRRPSYLTCSYITLHGDKIILIDAGMSSAGKDILYALQKLNRKIHDIQAVLLTHWHNDHSAGASYLNSLDIDVYAHEKEATILTTSSPASLKNSVSSLIPEMGPLVLLKGLLKEGPCHSLKTCKRVNEGDVLFNRFVALETPGHTGGHMAYFDQHQKVLYAGDALAVIKGQPRRMARAVTEDLAFAKKSMMKLLQVKANILCPGHRQPLVENVPALCKAFARKLEAQPHWPVFG
jgi:glyoxylase-like metal-dependent hydrolase (beta-lactamase superfamily II)